jgi:hypothetical protein
MLCSSFSHYRRRRCYISTAAFSRSLACLNYPSNNIQPKYKQTQRSNNNKMKKYKN